MTHNIHKMHKVYFSICSLAACHKIIYKFGWNKLIFSRCCASNHQLVNETLNLNELLWKATSLQKLNHTTQFEDLTLTRKGWTLVINVSFVFFLMTWNTRAECTIVNSNAPIYITVSFILPFGWQTIQNTSYLRMPHI